MLIYVVDNVGEHKKELKNMATKYISPASVVSPKAHWSLIDVLDDQGSGKISVALGRWDNCPVLGMRWNGNDNSSIGNPQSRGLPTWFIMPEGNVSEALIKELRPEKQALVRNFIPKPTR
jgi:hypothetical protein